MKYKIIILLAVIIAVIATALTLSIIRHINIANDIIMSEKKEPFLMLDNGLNNKKYNYQLPDSATKQELFAKCLLVQKWSADMVDYMQKLKIEMLKLADGPNTEAVDGDKVNLAKLTNKDDYDTPTIYMVGDDKKKGKAYELHTKFSQYHKSLLSIMNPKDTLAYTDSLQSEINRRDYIDPEDPEIDGWEKHIFYHAPMAAAIAHLSKLQADIRNDESVIINYFFMKAK
jgi:hypothetical protein